MNLANEIEYIATDAERQVIPYVRMKDRERQVREYVADGVTPEQLAKGRAPPDGLHRLPQSPQPRDRGDARARRQRGDGARRHSADAAVRPPRGGEGAEGDLSDRRRPAPRRIARALRDFYRAAAAGVAARAAGCRAGGARRPGHLPPQCVPGDERRRSAPIRTISATSIRRAVSAATTTTTTRRTARRSARTARPATPSSSDRTVAGCGRQHRRERGVHEMAVSAIGIACSSLAFVCAWAAAVAGPPPGGPGAGRRAAASGRRRGRQRRQPAAVPASGFVGDDTCTACHESRGQELCARRCTARRRTRARPRPRSIRRARPVMARAASMPNRATRRRSGG